MKVKVLKIGDVVLSLRSVKERYNFFDSPGMFLKPEVTDIFKHE